MVELYPLLTELCVGRSVESYQSSALCSAAADHVVEQSCWIQHKIDFLHLADQRIVHVNTPPPPFFRWHY